MCKPKASTPTTAISAPPPTPNKVAETLGDGEDPNANSPLSIRASGNKLKAPKSTTGGNNLAMGSGLGITI